MGSEKQYGVWNFIWKNAENIFQKRKDFAVFGKVLTVSFPLQYKGKTRKRRVYGVFLISARNGT
jgi:hypothetical protein